MTPLQIMLAAIRAAAQIAANSNDDDTARGLMLLAEGIESGRNIDQHMRMVGEQLAAGTAPSWDDIQARAQSEHERLQG